MFKKSHFKQEEDHGQEGYIGAGPCNIKPTKFHTHINEQGLLIKCYHQCKIVFFNWQFWAGLTMGFPLEHLLWEKVWPFNMITEFLLK